MGPWICLSPRGVPNCRAARLPSKPSVAHAQSWSTPSLARRNPQGRGFFRDVLHLCGKDLTGYACRPLNAVPPNTGVAKPLEGLVVGVWVSRHILVRPKT